MRVYPRNNFTETLQKLFPTYTQSSAIIYNDYFTFHRNFKNFFSSKESLSSYDCLYVLSVLEYFLRKCSFPRNYSNSPSYTLEYAKQLPLQEKMFSKTYEYFLDNSDTSTFDAKTFLLYALSEEELNHITDFYFLFSSSLDFNYSLPESENLLNFNSFQTTLTYFLNNFTFVSRSSFNSFQKEDKTFYTHFTKSAFDYFVDSSLQTDDSSNMGDYLSYLFPDFSFSFLQEQPVNYCPFDLELESTLPPRVNSIVVSSFCTGAKTSSFDVKSITRKQFFTNKGAFAFFTYSQKCLLSNQDKFFFTLINTKNYLTLNKYTKAKTNIKKLCNYLMKNDCLYFVNNDLYNERIQKNLAQYNKYCSNWAETLITESNVDQDELEESTYTPDLKNYSFISPVDSNLIFSEVNIDSANPEYKKVKETFTTLSTSTLEKFANSSRDFQTEASKLIMYLNTFVSAQQRLLEFYDQSLNTTFNEVLFPSESSYTFMNKVSEKFLPLQEERKNYLNNFNYDEVDISESNYFTNLNKTYNIELIEISYHASGKNYSIRADSVDSKIIKKMLVAREVSKDFQFTNIEFFTCKPSKILPNGNESKAIVAGPHKIRFCCPRNSSNVNLCLSLKDQSSIFGKSNRSFFIHPHCGPGEFTTNFKELLSIQSHACLGESTPYLYKALKENNLSSIFVNIFIWLNSANTADTWGRHYKYFPKYSDLVFNDKSNDGSVSLDLKEAITTAIVAEETAEENTLNTPSIEDVVLPPDPILETPVVESTTSIEPESPLQSIRAETTSPVNNYTPYVRTWI